ncbi:unnamed protein product [Arctogadus glacialis]
MIRPSLDPADVFCWRCTCSAVATRPELEGGLWTIRVGVLSVECHPVQHFSPAPEKGPTLYLAFPRGSAFKTFQTFQKGPALYLAFVFAYAGHLAVYNHQHMIYSCAHGRNKRARLCELSPPSNEHRGSQHGTARSVAAGGARRGSAQTLQLEDEMALASALGTLCNVFDITVQG